MKKEENLSDCSVTVTKSHNRFMPESGVLIWYFYSLSQKRWYRKVQVNPGQILDCERFFLFGLSVSRRILVYFSQHFGFNHSVRHKLQRVPTILIYAKTKIKHLLEVLGEPETYFLWASAAGWKLENQQLKGKLHSKIISSDMKDIFLESNGEGARSKIEREDSQTDGQKWPKNLGWRCRAAGMSHWGQASAVCGCVPILINPEFDAALDRDSCVTDWIEWAHLGQLCGALTSDNLFFFCRFVSVVWQDSDRIQSGTRGTWYSGRSSMLSSDSWLIDIGERSHPNPMHRSSLFQRNFQNRK